jgi:hypothetical protein
MSSALYWFLCEVLGLLAGVLISLVTIAYTQTPPTCEPTVQEQYRQLSTDGLVPQVTAPQWGPQLGAITTQVRTLRHQYDIKKQQAELAEQNIAQLLEQLRLAQQQLTALRAELEQQKTSTPPTPAAN